MPSQCWGIYIHHGQKIVVAEVDNHISTVRTDINIWNLTAWNAVSCKIVWELENHHVSTSGHQRVELGEMWRARRRRTRRARRCRLSGWGRSSGTPGRPRRSRPALERRPPRSPHRTPPSPKSSIPSRCAPCRRLTVQGGCQTGLARHQTHLLLAVTDASCTSLPLSCL